MKIKLLVVALIIVVAGGFVYWHQKPAKTSVSGNSSTKTASKPAQKAQAVNYCSGNSNPKEVIVSISKQHMWYCEANKTVYDNAVITGMESYPADLTPAGTYQIYAKDTNRELAGSDNTGSWDDHVAYWLPFLSNKYGVYGFHDADWRQPSDFGNIDVNAPFTTTAKSGSHGCVEMPVAAAKWLYDWSAVGTTVIVQS